MLFENAEFLRIWITSASIVACLIIAVISCVCGCRKKIPKNELLGLAGLVKITNPDENVNFNSPPNIQLNSVEVFTDDEINAEGHDPSKRGSNAVATATRSLPDLPVDSGDTSEKLWGPTENNVDTNSDLYATVEDANRKKRAVTSGGLTVDSSYTPSQTDDSLSPYARVKGEHPYDQLKQNEHPYAQVGSSTGPQPGTSQDTTVNSNPSRNGDRGEREDVGRSKSPSLTEALEEIPAASAIAGSVPANHDLPYMTPPIPVLPQQHFSGDSQDSAKGYTSISVREPLARILGRRGDPHYATVSDDSDEMYAAIEERNTSGSETYAQIAPPTTLPLQHQHSIERSSVSSCDDSPRGSREHRAANSPLPEPPAGGSGTSGTGMVDDMYAKVVKKRSPDSSSVPSSPIGDPEEPGGPPGYESLPDPNYEELHDPDYASLSRRYESVEDPLDPNYESVEGERGLTEPPYERVEAPDYEEVLREGGQELLLPEHILQLYAQVNKSPDKPVKQ